MNKKTNNSFHHKYLDFIMFHLTNKIKIYLKLKVKEVSLKKIELN